MSNKSELIQLDGSVRKKRRWDQPDELLISSGHATPGLLSTPTFGQPSVSLQGIMPTAVLTQTPLMQLQAAAVVQKLNQPKIQEDLVIAREIVINDADPALRYKLTKRQTQEEIQKCTGAVVITRGKYRPPNAVPDDDKPLYLHISSGAHLKETAERVLAVDRAAAMVEDMLKQVTQPMSTCVYVGFDADPSLNIAARICGPNDQYINHIINETGATVVLRGHGSGHLSNSECKEGQQPLHLFLSSNNQKSLEDARLLAENLLDTISKECGATRVSSCKLYGAVPPPQQLLAGVQNTGLAVNSDSSTTEKRLPHKRKFREAPTALIGIAGSQQGPGPHTPLKCASSAEKKIDAARPCTTLKNLQPPSPCHASTSYPSSSIMLLPLPPPEFRSPTSSLVSRSMLLPKSTSSFSANGVSKDNKSNVPNLPSVPDTLVKLMEYGDDDDDEETDDDENGVIATNPNRLDAAKPFWAV
ncbi:protein RIK-like isoform X2 [Silene latifolia]|uniref:protein RIK-like isoform X2 n=1 Tax=Silene latifolia TaxID=37657 RepID=UPI003D78A647